MGSCLRVCSLVLQMELRQIVLSSQSSHSSVIEQIIDSPVFSKFIQRSVKLHLILLSSNSLLDFISYSSLIELQRFFLRYKKTA